jgi:hypothetical protein
VKTDGLTVALLAERQAQHGRPLRRVQIELCRPGTRACKSSCAEINEVELLDRDPDENHLENHLLDGVWPTNKTGHPAVYRVPTHDAFPYFVSVI